MVRYPVCPADMNDCSKKCRYNYQEGETLYETKASDCANPCACYGSRYTLVDAGCENTNPGPPSISKPAIPPTLPPEQQQDPTLGLICTPEGITFVTACYSDKATVNFGGYTGNSCEPINVPGNIPDLAYVTDTIYFPDANTWCRIPFVPVRGFSGIRLEPGPPYSSEALSPFNTNLNADTCGNPTAIYVYAQGTDGLTYITSYFGLLYYGPFTTVNTIGSVEAKILTQPGYGSSCSTCGGEGQDVCPRWGNAQGDVPKKPIDDLREIFN